MSAWLASESAILTSGVLYRMLIVYQIASVAPSDFMIGQVSPIAFDRIRWRYYVVFCILSFTNAIAMWALVPEVVNRPLEEISALMEAEPCKPRSIQISALSLLTGCDVTSSGFIPHSAALRTKVKGTDVEEKIAVPAAKVMDDDEKKDGTTMVEHI